MQSTNRLALSSIAEIAGAHAVGAPSSAGTKAFTGVYPMNHLGSLRGNGRLKFDDHDARCSYAIDVYERRELKYGKGRIGADGGTLFNAVGKMLELVLSDGATMNVVISRQSLGSGEAEVSSSGPIPGF